MPLAEKERNPVCGIAGVLGNDGNERAAVERICEAMARTIRHRGPDDAGTWLDPGVGIGLAHTRLSVVDLSPAGHQPMHSACERYVIVFNGEIYNHKALREELVGDDPQKHWRGHSDTETLLACISSWGIEKTLDSLVGMFAFALWDRRENALTLARDRMGEKPLYWGWCGGTMVFASELEAFHAWPGFEKTVDRDALALLLRHNYIPAPYCIYRGIEKLCAGHYVQIRPGQTRRELAPKAYWSLKSSVEFGLAHPFVGTEIEAADLLESRLSESVGLQMLADVPLGAFLSGGIDSSTVVALMQRQTSRPVKTFAIGFDEPGFNEAEYAKQVAAHLKTDHTELYVGAEEALSVIPKLAQIYSEPFADSSQIPTFLVSELARSQVTVALSGDGGDELFGGYTPYQFAPKLWRLVGKLPLALRQLAVNLLAGGRLPDKLHKLLSVLPAQNREAFYFLLVSHWTNPEKVVMGARETATIFNSATRWPAVDSFEHRMMALDTQQYLPDDILVKVDRAAMANSLETRIPLLDHRVVQLAWQLPLRFKIRQGQGKWLLRQVLFRHVPRELIERPKQGFAVPLGQWLRGPLRDWAEALLEERRLQREGFFHVNPVSALWQEHLSGKRDNALKLWSILMFQAWLESRRGL